MKEIEDIILEKEYFELSADEKLAVADLADNEEDYSELKWFLSKTKIAAKKEHILPSPDLKNNVFAALESPAHKRIWLSGSGAVMTPKKRIYQMPAFQIGIAACVVVGFLLWNNPFKKDENLALNIPTEKEETFDQINSIGEKPLNDATVSEKSDEEDGGGNTSVIGLNEGSEDRIATRDVDQLNFDIVESNEETDNYRLADETSGNLFLPVPSSEIVSDDEVILEQEKGELFDDRNKDKFGNNQEGKITESPLVIRNENAVVLYKESEPGYASGTTSTGSATTEEIAEEQNKSVDQSNLGGVAKKVSIAKSDDLKTSADADIPVLNALSIAETPELKALFFTVP